MKLFIHTDGGSRGNPGSAGFGLVVTNEHKQTLYEFAGYIGTKTNNEAEYAGLISALTWCQNQQAKLQLESIIFVSDSQLLIRQVNGQYKVKSPHLKILHSQIDSLVKNLNCPVTFTNVLREDNTRADELANLAMDRRKNWP